MVVLSLVILAVFASAARDADSGSHQPLPDSAHVVGAMSASGDSGAASFAGAPEPRVCRYGTVGPDSLIVLGIDTTLYLLAVGQRFRLPSGAPAQLAQAQGGELMVVTRLDSVHVRDCRTDDPAGRWATPASNPLRTSLRPNAFMPHKVYGHGREAPGGAAARDAHLPSGGPIPGESPDSMPPAGAPAAPALPFSSARVYPRPPVLQIIGHRQTAKVLLWYEGPSAPDGIRCTVEPRGALIALLSVEPDEALPATVSLTYGRVAGGGLEIRLVSAEPLIETVGPLLALLVESRATGECTVVFDDVIVSFGGTVWAAGGDSLVVHVED